MSIRKAKTDFFSPMTGNVSSGRRTRDNLIMKAIKTKMVKTDDPDTNVGQQKSYAPKEDTKSISDSFDREYGVKSDEEASAFLKKAVKKVEKPDTSTSEPPTQTKPDPKPTPQPKPSTQPKPTPKPTTTEKAKKAVTVAKKVSSGSCPYGDGGYTGSLKGFCPYTQAEAVATKGYMSVADKKRIDNERIQAALARMN
tara:strand:+ start:263 stop:853 length:591 start_codon:yes stop_codon:yes gene_type:complete